LHFTFFKTSNCGAGNGFASLFPIYALLANSQETRLRDTVTQSANAAVLREIQQVKWPRMRKAYTEMLDRQKHMN